MPSDGVAPAARPAVPEAATPPAGASDAAEHGSATFLKGVLAQLRAENERLHAELDAQRAHSEALARSLAAARARNIRAQPQTKVLQELIRLRREQLTADRSVKELQHETKMMRSAFQARVAQLGQERDALLSAQQRMAEDGTRMAIEISELKRQLVAHAAEVAADRVRSASQPARRSSIGGGGAWLTPVHPRLASAYRAPATSPPLASLRERLELRRAAREAERSADSQGEGGSDGGDDDDEAEEEATEAESAAMVASPMRSGLTTPAATPSSRGLRPRTAQKTYTEPSLRSKMRRPRSPPRSARRKSQAPPPPSASLLGRAMAAAQALTARARLHLSPASPARPDEAEGGAAASPRLGMAAPPASPLLPADSASDSGADAGEEARRALSFERGQAPSESPPGAWADDAAELPPLASPFSAPPSPSQSSLPPALARPRRASFTNAPGAYREPSLVTKMRRNATT